jgi:hypothetical protein
MKLRYFIIVVTAVLCLQCKCEGTFTSTTKLKNLSSQTVNITLFSKKTITINEKITLRNDEYIKVGQAGGRGKGFVNNYPYLLSQVDSIWIEYNTNKKAVHYGKLVTGKNTFAIAYDNPRSLFNEENYVRKTITNDKCYLETEYRYTFTEQDVINAK